MNDYIYRGDALAVVQHSSDPVDGIKQLPGITLGTPDNEQIRRLVQDLRATQSRSKRELLDKAADIIEVLAEIAEKVAPEKYERAAELLNPVTVLDDPEMEEALRIAVDSINAMRRFESVVQKEPTQ